jgi:hypothetical protein
LPPETRKYCWKWPDEKTESEMGLHIRVVFCRRRKKLAPWLPRLLHTQYNVDVSRESHANQSRCDAVAEVTAMFRVIIIFLSAITVLTVGTFAALNDDATRAKLDEARTAYETEHQKARKAVLDRYAEVLKSLADNNKLDESLTLRDEMKVFETDGIMVGRPEMKKAFLDYGKTLKNAKGDLSAAYGEAVKQYTKALTLDKADELRAELTELNLPSKLVSLQLRRRQTLYVQHGNYLGFIRKLNTEGDRLNATFEMVPGLANKQLVSFRSANVPNFYLVHGSLRIRLQKQEDSEGFCKNATFKQGPGLAGPSASPSTRPPG